MKSLSLSLACGLAALIVVGGLLGHPRSASAAKRNIVLFVTDDQSPDAGCYGNQRVQTPHLDALATDGLLLTQAFCTTASCSASRSVILTGLYNHANAQYGHQHSYHHFRTYDTVRSLPVRLAQAGYRTARIGKFHVGPESVYAFDTVLPGNARSPVEMAQRCRQVIEADSDKPFFLYFCTSDPHRSGGHVEDDPHHPNPFGNRKQGYPGVREVRYNPREVQVHDFLPDTAVARAELAQYYQSVSRIDQGLGMLVQILKQAGVYEETLILFTSDHGIAFPGGKTTLYEGGMRVPMIMHDPQDARRGEKFAGLVSLVDLTPTLLEFAGVQDRSDLHGRSFLQAARKRDSTEFQEVYASHTFHEITMYYPMRVVRTQDYKLIWNIAHGLPYPFASDLWAAPTWQDIYRQGMQAMYGPRTVQAYIHRPKFELFDLKNDPLESKNLAGEPEHQQRLQELAGRIRQFQQKTKDPWILKWDYE